jgi:DeoR family fructose operon transcriptional repressor
MLTQAQYPANMGVIQQNQAISGMFAVERHRFITEHLHQHGRISVLGLAAELGLSPETIRRDLAQLEGDGILSRVHGGAVGRSRIAASEPTMAQRAVTRMPEKHAIARAALDLLPASGSIFLEAASTSLVLAGMIPPSPGLTIVTNGLPVAQVLAERDDVTVLMVGGRVRRSSMATQDDWALHALDGLHVNAAFLGTMAFSLKAGLTTLDQADAATKRRALKVADRTILLAESAKFEAVSVFNYGGIADLDTVVTDDCLPNEGADAMQRAGVEVIRAAVEQAQTLGQGMIPR